MKLFLTLVVVAVCINSQEVIESPESSWVEPTEPDTHAKLWDIFKAEFKKGYETVEEEASRFATFAENLQFIRPDFEYGREGARLTNASSESQVPQRPVRGARVHRRHEPVR
jgi:hypothetical protein